MSFIDEFDDILGDLDTVESRLMRKIQTQLNEILRGIKNGEIEGTFETREINEPGVKGFTIRGQFGTRDTIDPFEPLRPLRRRPMPDRPFEVPRNALKETHEPLTDIFDEEKAVKIYVELPGEKEDNIKLGFLDGRIEVKTGNFHKMINLPNKNIDMEAMSKEYRNGVLKITIPKRPTLRDQDAKKAKAV